MNKQSLQFATVSNGGVVEKVGRGVILQPKVNFKPKSKTNWYDDSKLIKKK